LVLSVE